MTAISRNLVVVACCLVVSACGTTTAALGSRVPFESVPAIPGSWGSRISSSLDEFGCPFVAGSYGMTPDVVEIKDGEQKVLTGNAFVYFNLFIGPLDGRKVESVESQRGPILALERQDADSLILRALGPDEVNETSWLLQIEPARLQCVDGYFQLPLREVSETVEGVWLNSQSLRRFATAVDGSLIYYEQFGPLKKLLGVGRTVTHRFYRFRRLEEGYSED